MCKDGFGGSEPVHKAYNLPYRLARLRMLTVSHGGCWRVHLVYSCKYFVGY